MVGRMVGRVDKVEHLFVDDWGYKWIAYKKTFVGGAGSIALVEIVRR